MKNQLKQIAESYDKAIDLGRKGIDSYNELPDFITDDPDYKLFLEMRKNENLSDSGRKEIYIYLPPKENMKFIDLGCCLNLMFRGYEKWKSTYYGVDISSKTIELLQEYTIKKNIKTGALTCCSMHETPFADSYFDIGTCIGSIEYFEKEFIGKVIEEINRIMKSKGKFVLDIPDIESPEFKITAKIEEYLGRPDKFNMSIMEFEEMIKKYFTIENKEKVGPMIQYFISNRKI